MEDFKACFYPIKHLFIRLFVKQMHHMCDFLSNIHLNRDFISSPQAYTCEQGKRVKITIKEALPDSTVLTFLDFGLTNQSADFLEAFKTFISIYRERILVISLLRMMKGGVTIRDKSLCELSFFSLTNCICSSLFHITTTNFNRSNKFI